MADTFPIPVSANHLIDFRLCLPPPLPLQPEHRWLAGDWAEVGWSDIKWGCWEERMRGTGSVCPLCFLL